MQDYIPINNISRGSCKWITLVDLQGLRPEQVVVKISPTLNILVVKELKSKQVLSVIPLPVNISLRKLKIEAYPRENVIVVKAPISSRQADQAMLEEEIFPTKKWMEVPVILHKPELDNLFEPLFYQSQQTQPRTYSISTNTNVNLNINKRHTIREDPNNDIFSSQPTNTTFSSFWPVRRQCEDNWYSLPHADATQLTDLIQATHHNLIRNEMSGKLVKLLKVNVPGFRPEDVRVLVNEKERILIVKAGNKSTKKDRHQREMLEMSMDYPGEDLPMKYLRRVYMLPFWVDMKYITFHVLKNSDLLLIQLPILQHQEKKIAGMMRNRNLVRIGCGCDSKCSCRKNNHLATGDCPCMQL